jgi:hypothetical protein
MSVFESQDKIFLCLVAIIILLIIVIVLCIACFSTLKAIKQRLYFISSANNDRYK